MTNPKVSPPASTSLTTTASSSSLPHPLKHSNNNTKCSSSSKISASTTTKTATTLSKSPNRRTVSNEPTNGTAASLVVAKDKKKKHTMNPPPPRKPMPPPQAAKSTTNKAITKKKVRGTVKRSKPQSKATQATAAENKGASKPTSQPQQKGGVPQALATFLANKNPVDPQTRQKGQEDASKAFHKAMEAEERADQEEQRAREHTKRFCEMIRLKFLPSWTGDELRLLWQHQDPPPIFVTWMGRSVDDNSNDKDKKQDLQRLLIQYITYLDLRAKGYPDFGASQRREMFIQLKLLLKFLQDKKLWNKCHGDTLRMQEQKEQEKKKLLLEQQKKQQQEKEKALQEKEKALQEKEKALEKALQEKAAASKRKALEINGPDNESQERARKKSRRDTSATESGKEKSKNNISSKVGADTLGRIPRKTTSSSISNRSAATTASHSSRSASPPEPHPGTQPSVRASQVGGQPHLSPTNNDPDYTRKQPPRHEPHHGDSYRGPSPPEQHHSESHKGPPPPQGFRSTARSRSPPEGSSRGFFRHDHERRPSNDRFDSRSHHSQREGQDWRRPEHLHPRDDFRRDRFHGPPPGHDTRGWGHDQNRGSSLERHDRVREQGCGYPRDTSSSLSPHGTDSRGGSHSHHRGGYVEHYDRGRDQGYGYPQDNHSVGPYGGPDNRGRGHDQSRGGSLERHDMPRGQGYGYPRDTSSSLSPHGTDSRGGSHSHHRRGSLEHHDRGRDQGYGYAQDHHRGRSHDQSRGASLERNDRPRQQGQEHAGSRHFGPPPPLSNPPDRSVGRGIGRTRPAWMENEAASERGVGHRQAAKETDSSRNNNNNIPPVASVSTSYTNLGDNLGEPGSKEASNSSLLSDKSRTGGVNQSSTASSSGDMIVSTKHVSKPSQSSTDKGSTSRTAPTTISAKQSVELRKDPPSFKSQLQLDQLILIENYQAIEHSKAIVKASIKEDDPKNSYAGFHPNFFPEHRKWKAEIEFTPTPITMGLFKSTKTRWSRFEPFWKMDWIAQAAVTSKVSTGKTSTVSRNKSFDGDTAAQLKFSLQNPNLSQRAKEIVGKIDSSKWGSAHATKPPVGNETRLLLVALPMNPNKNRADTHLWPLGTFAQITDQKTKAVKPIRLKQRTQENHLASSWAKMSYVLELAPYIDDPSHEYSIDILCAEKESFIFVVGLFQYQTPDMVADALARMKPPKKLSREVATNKAMKLSSCTTLVLDDDGDDNVEEEQEVGRMIFSLTDSVTKRVLENPVRGEHCSHFQCFELMQFLKLNTYINGQRWRCNVCEKFISPFDLEMCGLTSELCKEFHKEAEGKRDRVEFRSDRTYKLLDKRHTNYSRSKNKNKKSSQTSSGSAPSQSASTPQNEIVEIL